MTDEQGFEEVEEVEVVEVVSERVVGEDEILSPGAADEPEEGLADDDDDEEDEE